MKDHGLVWLGLVLGGSIVVIVSVVVTLLSAISVVPGGTGPIEGFVEFLEWIVIALAVLAALAVLLEFTESFVFTHETCWVLIPGGRLLLILGLLRELLAVSQ